MPDFMRHVRPVVRSLLRRPAFTVVVVLTLALGIGANSAIFTVVRAVLLKPLPYRAPESLALLWSRWINFDKTWLSPAEFADYERMDHLFESAAAWAENDEVALTGNGKTPESIVGALMTANMLQVVGMTPALGRTFTPEEDVPNGPSVVMLGYALWQRRYGGDPALVGQVLEIDGEAATVVGILPREFRFPRAWEYGLEYYLKRDLKDWETTGGGAGWVVTPLGRLEELQEQGVRVVVGVQVSEEAVVVRVEEGPSR